MSCITRTAFRMLEIAYQLNEDENCIISVVGSRALYLMTAPVELISSVADMSIGLVVATGAYLSLGMQQDVFRYAEYQLIGAGRQMLAGPYRCFLKTLSPTAECNPRNGQLLSSRLIQLTSETARECNRSDHVIIRHGASRLLYSPYAKDAI